MGNTFDTDLATIKNTLDTKSVTAIIINTHCIVCGKPFQVPRMSKLYCSTRCKQFGYNHKVEISNAIAVRDRGINQKPLVFFIDDFVLYDKKQKMLKRYRELEKKKLNCESINFEIVERQKFELPISDYLLGSYVSKKLTEDEENELCNNEIDLEEVIMDLIPKELSLEQWSFIKSLHPCLDEIAFFELTSSLSREFIGQLNLNENSPDDYKVYLVIKNKFINHCNLIAMGIIKFLKRGDNEK